MELLKVFSRCQRCLSPFVKVHRSKVWLSKIWGTWDHDRSSDGLRLVIRLFLVDVHLILFDFFNISAGDRAIDASIKGWRRLVHTLHLSVLVIVLRHFSNF